MKTKIFLNYFVHDYKFIIYIDLTLRELTEIRILIGYPNKIFPRWHVCRGIISDISQPTSTEVVLNDILAKGKQYGKIGWNCYNMVQLKFLLIPATIRLAIHCT